jgi:hypothetical protein
MDNVEHQIENLRRIDFFFHSLVNESDDPWWKRVIKVIFRVGYIAESKCEKLSSSDCIIDGYLNVNKLSIYNLLF